MFTLQEQPPVNRIKPVRANTFNDAGEYSGAFPGWRLEFHQLSAGRFSSDVVQLSLDGLQVIREISNQTLLKRGESRRGSVVLSVPLGASGHGWSGGRQLMFPEALLSDGHDLPDLVTPKALDVVSVVFDRIWFDMQAADFGYPELTGTIRSCHSLVLPEGKRLGLRDFFCSLFAELEHSPSISTYPESRQALEDAVLGHIVDALAAATRTRLPQDTPRKKIADVALAMAMRDTSQPLNIAAICNQLGVSRRHLQNCFQASFGLSATQLLRRIRLNHVRQELRRHTLENRPVSIGDVAARWGFWHWSRFAAEYKRHFGELPSATLRPR